MNKKPFDCESHDRQFQNQNRQCQQLITEIFDGLYVICIAFWDFFNGLRLMTLITIARKYYENPMDSFKKNSIDTITDVTVSKVPKSMIDSFRFFQ